MGSLVLTDTIITSPFQPITLRQWYAGLAMQGFMNKVEYYSIDTFNEFANRAYLMADAMIEEEAK
jgi:hypothetical protein